MNGLDVIIVVIVGFFLIKGLVKGLIKEFISFFGIIIAFLLAATYYPEVSLMLSPYIENRSFQDVAAFAIFFATTYILISIIGMGLNHLMTVLTVTKPLNITMGGVVGLVKGVFLASFLVVIMTVFMGENDPLLKNSVTKPYLGVATNTITDMVPKDLKKYLTSSPDALTNTFNKDLGEIKKDEKDEPAKVVEKAKSE